jgi:hypothetical protein
MGATATIQVRPLSTQLQPTLFGDIFEALLVPLENTIRINYSQEDGITKEVVAHLLNVPQYNGARIKGAGEGTSVTVTWPARLRFTGGGWKITIDGLVPWVYQCAFNIFDEDGPKDVDASELWRKRLPVGWTAVLRALVTDWS